MIKIVHYTEQQLHKYNVCQIENMFDGRIRMDQSSIINLRWSFDWNGSFLFLHQSLETIFFSRHGVNVQWKTFTNYYCLVSPLHYRYFYIVTSDIWGISISWHMFEIFLLCVKFPRNATSQNKNLIVHCQHQTGKKWVFIEFYFSHIQHEKSNMPHWA